MGIFDSKLLCSCEFDHQLGECLCACAMYIDKISSLAECDSICGIGQSLLKNNYSLISIVMPIFQLLLLKLLIDIQKLF